MIGFVCARLYACVSSNSKGRVHNCVPMSEYVYFKWYLLWLSVTLVVFHCRFWGLVGLGFSGNIWLNLGKCGGHLTWSWSPCSGIRFRVILYWSADVCSHISCIRHNCRALHEKEERPKGGTTLNQFFLLVLICSFAYYVLPGYLFSTLTSLSWVCWLAPKSVLVQQLGSGLDGLGIGSFGID